MNCQKAYKLLYDYIDKEIGDIDAQEIRKHLEACSPCFEVFRLEESVQALINEKLSATASVPKLDGLKASILTKLDEIDNDAPVQDSKRPPFFRMSQMLAIAAAIVVLLGASSLIKDFYSHNRDYIPLEQAHWSSVDNATEYEDEELTSQLMSAVYDKYDYYVNDEVSGFHLAGGRGETIQNNEMSHFLYSKDGKMISVFVVDGGTFKIPDELKGEIIKIGGRELYDHNCRGCRLVYQIINNSVVITATTDRDIDLLEFAPHIGAI